MKITEILSEAKAVKQRLDAKCWTGKHKEGTKIKGGVRVNNCVPNESVTETVYPNAEVIKSKNGKEIGEIYQTSNGEWGCFHHEADRGYEMWDTREDALASLKQIHRETPVRRRPTPTNKVMKDGVEEGWKDVAAGAAMVGALGAGAYQGAKHSAPTTNIDGKQFVMYRHTPGDYERNKMKLTTDDAGNKVYAWVTKSGMKPQYTYRYYIPAEEGVKDGVEEEKAGLYANVQAKRERIKHGSGEHMRKPGSKGAPTSQSWKDAAKTAKTEAANPAQQAAIAIAKKKEKGVKEGETGPKFTGYYKGTDKGKPGKKMVGDA